MLFGSVIDQDVQPIQLRDALSDRSLAKCLSTDVSLEEQALGAVSFDALLCFFRVLRLVKVDDRHIGAFTCEMERYRTPNSAITAGNERNLSG
jgi:hypothetical protein